LLLIGGVVIIALIVFIFQFASKDDPGKVIGPPPEPIVVWGVFHEDPSLSGFDVGFPIQYKNFDIDVYEEALVSALAAGVGPDVYMIHNTWLPKFADKINPLNPGNVSILTIRDQFPFVVEQNFTAKDIVYALPLYIDTLAMYYSKPLFEKSNIVFPPKTWEALERDIPHLRRTDSSARITQAAATIGGSERTVNRMADIMSLLLLQNGVPIVDEGIGGARFASKEGEEVFNYYLQFSDPKSENYTWNDDFLFSIDAFAEDRAAITFNYSHLRETLKKKQPFLRYEIRPMLQKEGGQETNYANYWGMTVSRQSSKAATAWEYIKAMSINEGNAKRYVETYNRPPALLTLINQFINDPTWGVFARQALTARSWFQIDNNIVEEAFSNVVRTVLIGRDRLPKVLGEAEGAINDAMRKRGTIIDSLFR